MKNNDVDDLAFEEWKQLAEYKEIVLFMFRNGDERAIELAFKAGWDAHAEEAWHNGPGAE